jgi:hypothetical protein
MKTSEVSVALPVVHCSQKKNGEGSAETVRPLKHLLEKPQKREADVGAYRYKAAGE